MLNNLKKTTSSKVYIHRFKSDLINDIDHMRFLGDEPLSQILRQTMWFQK